METDDLEKSTRTEVEEDDKEEANDDDEIIEIATNDKENQNIKQELCVVCDDLASGYHYSVLACEGCKVNYKFDSTIELWNKKI